MPALLRLVLADAHDHVGILAGQEDEALLRGVLAEGPDGARADLDQPGDVERGTARAAVVVDDGGVARLVRRVVRDPAGDVAGVLDLVRRAAREVRDCGAVEDGDGVVAALQRTGRGSAAGLAVPGRRGL